MQLCSMRLLTQSDTPRSLCTYCAHPAHNAGLCSACSPSSAPFGSTNLAVNPRTVMGVLLQRYANKNYGNDVVKWWILLMPFMEILITITTYAILALQDRTPQNVLITPLQFPSSL